MANLWGRGLYQRGKVGHSGLQGEVNRDKIVVTAIDEGSPEAGKLHVGDELIALNGIYLKDDLSILQRFRYECSGRQTTGTRCDARLKKRT